MQKIFSLISIILLLVFFVWSMVRGFRRAIKGDDVSILPRAEEEFRTLVINHELPELSFDGNSAEIVKNWREGITYNNIYTLHRICRFARNEHGEYFYFMSDGSGRPFFKHVTQVNAKIALGKKYIAPVSVR